DRSRQPVDPSARQMVLYPSIQRLFLDRPTHGPRHRSPPPEKERRLHLVSIRRQRPLFVDLRGAEALVRLGVRRSNLGIETGQRKPLTPFLLFMRQLEAPSAP